MKTISFRTGPAPLHRTLIAVVLAACVSSTAVFGAPADIVSDFDSDRENWSVTGDFFPLLHFSAGGDEDGYIGYTDQAVGDSIEFIAPEKFLGDLSAYRDGTLSYSLRVTTSDFDFYPWTDVRISGVAGTLTLENTITALTAPIGRWTRYDFVLGESQGWNFQPAGSDLKFAAGDAAIALVLANVNTLAIRGEFIEGDEFDALDSVRLSAAGAVIPEPSACAAVGGLAAVAAVACRRVRRSKDPVI